MLVLHICLSIFGATLTLRSLGILATGIQSATIDILSNTRLHLSCILNL